MAEKQKKKGNKPVIVSEKKQAVKKQTKPQVTGDWLYFCPKEVGVRDWYDVVADSYESEIWEDAGVLEIILGDKSSLDVEETAIHPKDEPTQQFADTQGAKSVFLVTFMPEEYEVAERIMKLMLERFGGIFCGDTEDFMPQVCM